MKPQPKTRASRTWSARRVVRPKPGAEVGTKSVVQEGSLAEWRS